MSVLTKLLRESYDLQEERGEETAYWHLQKLRQAIKDEQIKRETLLIDSVVGQSEQLCDDWIHEERIKNNDDNYCPICGKKLQ